MGAFEALTNSSHPLRRWYRNVIKMKVANVSIKQRLKRRLQAIPWLWSVYWRTKQEAKRVLLLRYFLYDIRHTYRFMSWTPAHKDRRTLSAELLFQFHKLEKGLVMPGKRRLFGIDPALRLCELVDQWERTGHPTLDPVYRGALETLNCYSERLAFLRLDPDGEILPAVLSVLRSRQRRSVELSTPRPLPDHASPQDCEDSFGWFSRLAEARRSVREFQQLAVDAEAIARAVSVAQLSPSACNRQPCRFYVVSDPQRRNVLLSHQNGNRGFGHTAPHVGIITSDELCFFDASERHEPYIDGGLFAMSLALAFRAEGVGTCCLNWCVPPSNDRAVHAQFNIPPAERIVMLMAFGYPVEDCWVPRSPRRNIDEVLIER